MKFYIFIIFIVLCIIIYRNNTQLKENLSNLSESLTKSLSKSSSSFGTPFMNTYPNK